MRAALLSNSGGNTYALVFATGDEVMAGLSTFAETHGLRASHFTAIGALSDATLGFFAWDKKTYMKIPIQEQVEVLSLVGDIVLDGGKPKVHAHVVLGRSDGTAHGGHLMEAHVRPTLEVMLVESPKHLARTPDAESGLALINLDALHALGGKRKRTTPDGPGKEVGARRRRRFRGRKAA